jgi:hypothetical protein
LNAVSRFDANRHKRGGLQRLPVWVPAAIGAAGALVLMLFVFQFFFRYQYFTNSGSLWRLDRLTQQTCQVSVKEGGCVAPRFSTSTSTSTSTSPSLSVKYVPKKKH